MKINEKVRIIGRKCELVPYEAAHVPKYHKWMEDEEIRRLTGSEPLSLEEEFEMQKTWRQDDDKLTFVVLCHENDAETLKSEENRMVGDVNLFINEGEAEVEVMIAEPSGRGKGIGQEAVQIIISYAINNLQIRKFCVKITDDNVPSLSLFEKKLEFVRVSHSRAFGEYTMELPEEKINKFADYLTENAQISSYPP
ncbi:unnamed protein product [Caenorhabditis sp. 36 PRJEB53466]|nr:unnamed protein product [Caenorhabditis sp. 36 PRJEB53466]